jgi:hypothetical protein
MIHDGLCNLGCICRTVSPGKRGDVKKSLPEVMSRNAAFHAFSSPLGHFSSPFSSTSGKSPMRGLTHEYNGGVRGGRTSEGADVPPLRTCGGRRFSNTAGIKCVCWSHCPRGLRAKESIRGRKWLICAGKMTSVDLGFLVGLVWPGQRGTSLFRRDFLEVLHQLPNPSLPL